MKLGLKRCLVCLLAIWEGFVRPFHPLFADEFMVMREPPDGSDYASERTFPTHRLMSALKCVGAVAMFWIVLLLTPWSKVYVTFFGLTVWLAWMPALVLMSIAACLFCMTVKDVFETASGRLGWWVGNASLVAIVATLVLGVIGSAGKEHFQKRAEAVGMLGDESKFWKYAVAHEERRTFVDARNVCQFRVQAFLDGVSKRDSSIWEFSQITEVQMRVNGKPVTDAAAACDSLLNNRVVFSLAPPPQDEAVQTPSSL